MTPLEKAGFVAHARLPVFRRRVESTRGIIAAGLALGPSYVACSWGKDSIVMTHLVQSVDPEVPVVFFADPDQDMIDDYAGVSSGYMERFPTVYEELNPGGDRVPHKLAASRIWQRYRVAFVGVREEECNSRRMDLIRHGEIHQYTAGARAGSYRVWPLGKWSWKDVWGYICLHDLPYLPSYDAKMADDKRFSRTCNVMPKFMKDGPKGANMGRINRLRARNPAYYNYLCQNFPEIAFLGS